MTSPPRTTTARFLRFPPLPSPDEYIYGFLFWELSLSACQQTLGHRLPHTLVALSMGTYLKEDNSHRLTVCMARKFEAYLYRPSFSFSAEASDYLLDPWCCPAFMVFLSRMTRVFMNRRPSASSRTGCSCPPTTASSLLLSSPVSRISISPLTLTNTSSHHRVAALGAARTPIMGATTRSCTQISRRSRSLQ